MILNFIIEYTDKEIGSVGPPQVFTSESYMVVCLCKGVSDKKIKLLLENGATCLRDVMASCQAGSDCGSCICQLKEMVQKSRQRHAGGGQKQAGEAGSGQE